MRPIMTQPDPATLLFEFPQPASRGLPQATLRLRLESLACGAVRVTRTLRESFLPYTTPVVTGRTPGPVSYTHLDVYKRQSENSSPRYAAQPNRPGKPA